MAIMYYPFNPLDEEGIEADKSILLEEVVCEPSVISEQELVLVRNCWEINRLGHDELRDACHWIFISACRQYVPNLDFLTYTRERFGDVRYGFYNFSTDMPDLDAHIVIVTNRFSMINLSAFAAITSLIMTDCDVDDTKIKEFTTLSFPHLQHLSLHRNSIGCQGACDLADMLMQNTTLKTLELTQNQIQMRGALALVKLIDCNITLTHMTVCKNPLNGNANFYFKKCLNWYRTGRIRIDQLPEDGDTENDRHMERYLVDRITDAVDRNVTLDQFCAWPFAGRQTNGVEKRQRMFSIMVAALRRRLFLGDDLWLHAMRAGMALS